MGTASVCRSETFVHGGGGTDIIHRRRRQQRLRWRRRQRPLLGFAAGGIWSPPPFDSPSKTRAEAASEAQRLQHPAAGRWRVQWLRGARQCRSSAPPLISPGRWDGTCRRAAAAALNLAGGARAPHAGADPFHEEAPPRRGFLTENGSPIWPPFVGDVGSAECRAVRAVAGRPGLRDPPRSTLIGRRSPLGRTLRRTAQGMLAKQTAQPPTSAPSARCPVYPRAVVGGDLLGMSTSGFCGAQPLAHWGSDTAYAPRSDRPHRHGQSAGATSRRWRRPQPLPRHGARGRQALARARHPRVPRVRRRRRADGRGHVLPAAVASRRVPPSLGAKW